MYNWETGTESGNRAYVNLILFVASASIAVLLFLVFYPQIDQINRESPILINLMFLPAAAIGFLYGVRITERVVKPSEIRSPLKRSIVKTLLFFFVIGSMFSAVNFALNGGSTMPTSDILKDGLIPWINEYVTTNGGATFLILTSIALMAGAGILDKLLTCVSTFIFFTMLILSFTKSDHTSSAVFLYTFYHAGIVGGAFYAMNKLTKNLNMVEDFANGY
jgi:hypothetical protein